MKLECREKASKCGRCNKAECNYNCEKANFKCANCGGNHSSNYKGCSIYKKELEKIMENK